MLRTRAGYCGGDKVKPDYGDMGDHTEAISVDYDPEVISYGELLSYFWNGHRCERNNSSVQYQNALFYRDDVQRVLAEGELVKRASDLGLSLDEVATKVLPMKEFTYAEKYHQKYAVGGGLRAAVDGLFSDGKELADSTVITRVNAYLGDGLGQDRVQFLAELSEYGLPLEIENEVRRRVER